MNDPNQIVLLFDGICNLCNSSVQFIIKHDKNGKIKFSSLQSDIGKELLNSFDMSTDYIDSLIFIDKGKVHTHLGAVLRSTKYLNGLYPLLQVFLIIPKFLSNPIYNWIARNRYSWFGKRNECMIPTPEIQTRFL